MSSVGQRPRIPRFLPPDPRVEEPYRVTPPMALRIGILGFVAVILFGALFFRLWALQVISGERYLEEARNNQVRTFRAPATRGTISDRDGDLLVSNVPGTAVQLWPAALDEMPEATRTAVVRRVSRLLGVPAKGIRAALRSRANDPLTPVTVKEDVGDAKAQYLLEHQAKFPGVQVAQTELRNYEQGVLASQLLGYVAEITAEQLEERREKGYALGDRIGQTGVEASYDRYLRGVAGVGQVRVDALGRITSDREFSQLPESGYSLRLTLDDDLQRAAEEALRYGIGLAHEQGEWAASGGAIVAMDPNNGEVLAMASHPTFDPSVYVGRIDPEKLDRLAAPQANYPTLNRATAGLYPPGSTFKPVTALAAIQEGFLTSDELIQCTGRRVVGQDQQVFMNWDPTKNEPMTLTTAIANSCDTYFYEVALRAYERRDTPIQTWARRMGFGAPTGFDVGPEGEGLIPTPHWRRRTFTTAIDKLWKSGDSVQLGIGQGDVLVTPLQMTRFFALLANGGKLVRPHVVKQVEQPTPEGDSTVVVRPFTPPPPKDIGLDPSAIRVVQEGLYDATHTSYGTATSVFGSFPVPIAGKTGTAEKYIELPGFKGLRDQSWWCGYGPYDKPDVVICAVIENGGYGGEAAAPAALKVFEEFFDVAPGSYVARTVESD